MTVERASERMGLSSPPAIDDAARVGLLSPRQRECLRLAYNRRQTKEIAAALGIAPGTVATYCTEAIRLLAARDRRHAAELLHAWEQAHGTPSGVEPPLGGVAEAAESSAASESAVPSWARLLPFRYKDAPGNDLPVLARLFWIPVLATGIAVAFQALVGAAHLIGDLMAGASRR